MNDTTETVAKTVTNDFAIMGLPKSLITRLTAMGITEPTPIQNQAIPHALNGRDVMGLAQTGTGKTAAFGLPLVAQMLASGGRPAPKTVRGLVLAPTRELAGQIAEHLRAYSLGSPLKVAMVVGGQSINTQIKRLERGVDLLVATPGRLIDLMDRRALRLDETTFLVLDEADQMLDLGFIHALRKIAAMLPDERQTMLFSATMPKQMNELASSYLTRPIRVEVSPPGKPADKVTQEVHFIAKAEKPKLLIEKLDKHRDELALVFGRTKHGCEKLMKSLVPLGRSMATNRKVSVTGRLLRLRRVKFGCLWPQMSQPGGSIFLMCVTSTILICPMYRKTMSTGLAGQHVPVPMARQLHSVRLTRWAN